MKSFRILMILAVVFVLTGCQKDEQKDKLFLINQEEKAEMKDLLKDEEIEKIIKETYKNEEFVDIIAIELSKKHKGSEVFTLSTTDERTYFRVFKRVKDSVELIWEKESFYNSNQIYNLESIAPNVLNETNMLIISRYKNPQMNLSYFVIGQIDKDGEVEIIYDNEFQNNEPIRRGEIRAYKDRIELKSDGMFESTLYISTDGMVKTNQSF